MRQKSFGPLLAALIPALYRTVLCHMHIRMAFAGCLVMMAAAQAPVSARHRSQQRKSNLPR